MRCETANICTILRSEKVTFARNNDHGMMDTPGTVYMSIKMGENRDRLYKRQKIKKYRVGKKHARRWVLGN